MQPITRLTDDELLAQLQQAIAALPDAPAALLRAAHALWNAPPVATPRAGGMRRLLATLSFDSRTTTAPALGLRSASSPTRHWLFSTEGRDIDVRAAPDGATWQVSGQVLGPDAAGLVRLAAADGAQRREVALGDLGEFRFESVTAGLQVLTLQFDDLEIVLPPVAVGGTPP